MQSKQVLSTRTKLQETSDTFIEMSGVQPNDEQSADILKLDIDCCDEIFDYLSMVDLLAVSKTCKRFSQVAGYIFHEKYPKLKANCISDEAKLFPKFVRNVRITFEDGYSHFVRIQSHFSRLEEINMDEIKITPAKMESIQESLNKVNSLRLRGCKISSDSLKTLIDSCPRIKFLSVNSSSINGRNDWLLHKYPTLESLQLIYISRDTSLNIVPILELNPNIQQFAIDAQSLLACGQTLKDAKITLDYMIILIGDDSYPKSSAVSKLLEELYELGIYKRLFLYYHIILDTFNQWGIDQLTSLKGLVNIKAHTTDGVSLSNLTSLEVISFHSSKRINDFAVLPKTLANLKRVHFAYASIADLMVLINQAPRLDKIIVDCYYLVNEVWNGIDTDTKVLNLYAMNKARQKISNSKLTIYIDERVYLATKWAMKTTECGLIRLERVHSYKSDNNFRSYL